MNETTENNLLKQMIEFSKNKYEQDLFITNCKKATERKVYLTPPPQKTKLSDSMIYKLKVLKKDRDAQSLRCKEA